MKAALAAPLALGVVLALSTPLLSQAQAAAAPIAGQGAPIVFFDIAGPDSAKLKSFYASNFGWSIDAKDAIKTPKLEGTLRQDPKETLIYVGVPDVDAALKKIVAEGGGVAMKKVIIPKVVTFAIFTDPAGNRMGLVELQK